MLHDFNTRIFHVVTFPISKVPDSCTKDIFFCAQAIYVRSNNKTLYLCGDENELTEGLRLPHN